VYAQALGAIFTEAKPYVVELCVAEVAYHGETKPLELYRITYDGSIADEPHFVVMGGTTEPITNALKDSFTENADLRDALGIAVRALRAAVPTETNAPSMSPPSRWPSWMPTGRGARVAHGDPAAGSDIRPCG
jgi:proteasome alpha subunit